MTLLVTGGAGFIGANFVLDWLAQTSDPVINLDKVTYAGNLETLAPLQGDARHAFVQGDIGHGALVSSLQSAGSASAQGRTQLRCRKPRRPFYPQPGRLRQDHYRRHLSPAGVGARLLA